MDPNARPPLHPPAVHTMGLGHLPLAALVTVLISALYSAAFTLGTLMPIAAVSLLVLMVGFAATGLTPGSPRRTGSLRGATAGSRFTVARLALTCLLAGVAAARPASAPDAMLWSLAAMGAVAAVLDASDGWMTRITGSASGYADRLSALIACVLPLALALLAWQTGRAGAWIVAAGLPAFLAGAPSLAVRGHGANARALAALAMNALLAATLLPVSSLPEMPQFMVENLPLLAGIGAVSAAFGLAAHAFVIAFGGGTARNRPDSGS